MGYIYSPETVRRVIQLFPRDESEFNFIPTIHRIVLGISQQSLAEYLGEYNGSLNCSKLWGYTVFEWAALKKDHNALRSLLQFEENNRTRKSLAESVMFLVRCRPCLDVLLAMGANINVQPKVIRCGVLHNSLNLRLPRDFIVHLLESGADPNACTMPPVISTPLSMCSFGDRADMAALLISYGADVNFMTSTKMIAVSRNVPE